MAKEQLAAEARGVDPACGGPFPLPHLQVLICSEQAFYSCCLYTSTRWAFNQWHDLAARSLWGTGRRHPRERHSPTLCALEACLA